MLKNCSFYDLFKKLAAPNEQKGSVCSSLNMLPVGSYATYLTIGRFSDLWTTSEKPALRNLETIPVKTKGSGSYLFPGSVRYPSMILASCCRAKSTAALSRFVVTPLCLNCRTVKKQTTDQTSLSSTRLSVLERSSEDTFPCDLRRTILQAGYWGRRLFQEQCLNQLFSSWTFCCLRPCS